MTKLRDFFGKHKNHKVVRHVKKHHKHYLIGGFGLFGVIKMFMLFFSLFAGYQLYNQTVDVFAADWTNNDDFLDEGFWKYGTPSDSDFIDAIYGKTGAIEDDFLTAYTQNWTGYNGQCVTGAMNVVYLNPGTINSRMVLTGYTIYVLNEGTYIVDNGVYMRACNAFIGSGIVNVYSSNQVDAILYNSGYGINILREDGSSGLHDFNVIDNINVDGINDGSMSVHARNTAGILFKEGDGQANFTMNNVGLANNEYGLIGSLYYGLVNNSQFFNNTQDGFALREGSYGLINNSQFYNNQNLGFYIEDGINYISINNSQFYNNDKGVLFGDSEGMIFNNNHVYNNNLGIDLNGSTSGYLFNNTYVYNNITGIQLDGMQAVSNGYYGVLKMFDNDVDFDGGGLVQANGSSKSNLNWSNGTLDTGGCMSCDWITNPNWSSYLQTGEYCDTRGYISGFGGGLSATPDFSYKYGISISKQITGAIYSGGDYYESMIDIDETEYISQINKEALDYSGSSCDVPFVELLKPSSGLDLEYPSDDDYLFEWTGKSSDGFSIQFDDNVGFSTPTTVGPLSSSTFSYNKDVSTFALDTIYYWRVKNEELGNYYTSGWNFQLIDTTKPTVTLSQPSSGEVLTDSGDIIQWSINDNYDGTFSSDIYFSGPNNLSEIDKASIRGTNFHNMDGFTDGDYEWYVLVTDQSGNTGRSNTGYFSVELDTDAPVIVINNGTDVGPVQTDTINITVNDSGGNLETSSLFYGFSSNATCDSGDTYNISFSSDVDFYITGDYTNYLCVSVADTVGNTGYYNIGRLNTDNTKPISRISYIPDGPSWTSGDVLSTITGDSENIIVTNNNSGYTYLFTGNGDFTFEFRDEAGNTGDDRAVVDWIDKTKPEVYSIYPENGHTYNTLMIWFEWTGTDNVGVEEYSLIFSGRADVHTSSTNTGINVGFVGGGTFSYYVLSRDIAGNTGVSETRSFTINLDSDAPVVSATNSSNEWKNSDIDITLNVSDDNLSGAWYRWNNTDCWNGTLYSNGNSLTQSIEGEYTLYLCAEDTNGNTGTWNGTYKLDKTDPSVNLSSPSDGETLDTGNVNLIWNGSDITAGISGYMIYVDGQLTGSTTNTGYTLNGLGNNNYTWNVVVVDNAGNTGQATQRSFDVNVDNVGPNVSTGYIYSGNFVDGAEYSYYNGIIDIKADVTDADGISGNTCEYTINNGVLRSGALYSGTNNTGYCYFNGIDGNIIDGGIIIGFRVSDLNGNISIGNTKFYQYDNRGPTTGNFNINSNDTYTNTGLVDLIFTECPTEVQGIANVGLSGMYISNDPIRDSSDDFYLCDEPYTITGWVLSGDEGTNTVYMRGVDKLGNLSEVVTDDITLDTLKPNGSISYNPSIATNDDVQATITLNETGTITNNSGLNTYTFTGNNSFTFEFGDEAGNTGAAIAIVTWIDKEEPTFSGVISGAVYSGSRTILFEDNGVITISTLNGLSIDSGYIVSGTNTYVLYIEDEAGNTTGATFEMDNNAPDLAWTNGVSESEVASDIVAVDFKDSVYSGYKLVTNTGDCSSTGLFDYTGAITYNETGVNEYYFCAYGRDAVGNEAILYSETKFNINISAATIQVDDNFDHPRYTGEVTMTGFNLSGDIRYKIVNTGSECTNTSGEIYNEMLIFTGDTDNNKYVCAYASGLSEGIYATGMSRMIQVDREAPVILTGDITYNPAKDLGMTSGDVVATIILSESGSVTNNSGSLSYTFTGNDSFTFEFDDLAGNTGSVEAKVDWIDKIAPVITGTTMITPTADDTPSYTFESNEAGTIVYGGACDSNDTGAVIGSNTVEFNQLEDGTYNTCTIMVYDEAGNQSNIISIGEFVIDTAGPLIQIVDGIETGVNNGDTIELTIGDAIFVKRDYNPTNSCSASSSGVYTYELVGNSLFIDNEDHNGEYVCFYGEDALGNKRVVVTNNTLNIDVTKPVGSINYAPGSGAMTNDDVQATITLNETGTITNNSGLNTYTFTGNDSFTFEFVDEAGNTGAAIATVTWIDNNGAILTEVSPVVTPTSGNNLAYTFSSTKSGTIIYGGTTGCTSLDISVISGNNIITFASMSEGTYNCTIQVEDGLGNMSNTLNVNQFEIDRTGPTLGFDDTVEIGPVASDDVDVDYGDSAYSRYKLVDTGSDCNSLSTSGYSGVVTYNDSGTNNKYFCVYAEDSLGNPSTLVSTNKLNIDDSAIDIRFGDPVNVGPVQSDIVSVTGTNLTNIQYKWVNTLIECNNMGTNLYSSTLTYDTQMHNGEYFCVYAEDNLGKTGILLSTNTLNIDIVDPDISGVADGGYYNDTVSPQYTDGNNVSATLNGGTFVSGNDVVDEGSYELIVTDEAGNSVQVNFEIDKTVATYSGVENGGYYNYTINPTFGDDNLSGATLNGNPFNSGDPVSDEGIYILIIEDKAGNRVTVNFVVDKTVPLLTGIVDIPSPINDITPELTIGISEPATLLYSGSCTGDIINGLSGENVITFGPLEDGVYDDCYIGIEDFAGNTGSWLYVNPFEVKTSCDLPWGGTIASGDTITAYSGSSVACGETCVSEIRSCNNGTLSGTYNYVSCSVDSCGGGGGGFRLVKDDCPDGDNSPSYYDKTCEGDDDDDDEDHESGPSYEDECEVDESDYSTELKGAYLYGYNYGITTMCPIQDADLYGPLTRIAMAKMISSFVIEVLGLEPDVYKDCDYPDVSEELDEEYNNGMTQACQLGLMGVNMTEFKPFDLVNRAQFATVLSRILYGDTYNDSVPYYDRHIVALNSAGIINNIGDPMMLEKRGYVMLMMQRVDNYGLLYGVVPTLKGIDVMYR